MFDHFFSGLASPDGLSPAVKGLALQEGVQMHQLIVRHFFVIAAYLAAAGSHAATITALSDGFEAEGFSLNYASFGNWTVTDGTVDTVGPTFGTPPINCQGSSVCVDLDGSSFDVGVLSTTDTFAVGSYSLSFDISGSQRSDTNTVTVAFGDLLEDFTLDGGAGWTTITRTVNVSAEGVLSFENISASDNSGIILDNVSVSPVPIPAAAWLFVSALLGLGALKRKRS